MKERCTIPTISFRILEGSCQRLLKRSFKDPWQFLKVPYEDCNKFSLGAPTPKLPKVEMSYGKRRAWTREGAGAKAPEYAIAAGRWVGRQTRFLVSGLTKRGMNSIKKRPIYTKLQIYAQQVPPRIHTYFLFRAKCWLRGGVGGQFPKNLNWSHYFNYCKQHKWALKNSSAEKFSIFFMFFYLCLSLYFLSYFLLSFNVLNGYFYV